MAEAPVESKHRRNLEETKLSAIESRMQSTLADLESRAIAYGISTANMTPEETQACAWELAMLERRLQVVIDGLIKTVRAVNRANHSRFFFD